MKRKILFIAAICSVKLLSAQVTDTVSTGANYVDENYYTLMDGNEVQITRGDWDLAFAADGLGFASSTIRINGAMGAELFKYGNNINDWSTVDTTGFNWSANQLIDSDTAWTTGAFENTTPTNGFDLGWGTYSVITHIVSGDKIFILKLASGDYKKLIINNLANGIYSFKYADINGANEVNTTLTKSTYSGKNFGYYSIQNGLELDREPMANSWDLLFTKYIAVLGGGTYYGVTGLLANSGVKVAQVNNVGDVNNISALGHNYETEMNVIGYDWKTYSFALGGYVITDSLVYFVELPNDDIYKLIFTGFGGSSDGNYIFTKEQIFAVGIDEDFAKSEILNVYPNPASEVVNVTFVNTEESTTLSVYNLAGKELINKNIVSNGGLSQQKIDVSHLSKGTYILMLTSENTRKTQKIIIQ